MSFSLHKIGDSIPNQRFSSYNIAVDQTVASTIDGSPHWDSKDILMNNSEDAVVGVYFFFVEF